ncbi:MAG: tRNA lysidine(34) synthetase TilS [Clostridia bacterium]
MKSNLINIVKNNILNNNVIENNDKIVIAVSGGPDSIALLDIIYNLKSILKLEKNIDFDFVVAHVNHMIREESKYEKVYVEDICLNKSIPFFYLKKDVIKESTENRMGTEEYARKIRYDFFEEVRVKTGSNKIAVAHNLDDNVETILLNIIRGCGIKGLCGMDYKFKNVIRPLIEITKKEILDYCNINKLNPCFDKTNDQEIYMRNKIRLKLLPMLEKEYNNNFKNNLLRLSKIASQDEECLNTISTNIVDSMIIVSDISSITFNFENMLKQNISIKQRCVLNVINKLQNNVQGIENIHINDIIKLLDNNLTKKKYIIGNKFTIEILKKNIAKIYINNLKG